MDKALNYLALARKAGLVELGEEPVGAVARSGHARLIVVAGDASEHTWHRALGFADRTELPCLRVAYTKDQLGRTVGRASLAMAAFTDPALALAFVQALGQPEKHRELLARLEKGSQRARQRQQEEKAHQRNLRRGRRRTESGSKQD